MIDIRLHGRGGQGVMTSSYLIAEAALLEDKYVHAFPSFGPERSGAPIAAFARVSESRFYVKTEIYKPDIVIVQDPTLLGQVDVLSGLKEGGLVIINTDDPNSEGVVNIKKSRSDAQFATVDATKIAAEEIGIKQTNTAILGALVNLTNSSIITLDSIKKAIMARFREEPAKKNINAVDRSFNEVSK
ncbi:MAG: 2-oxoacid:acceptor oxidoreductase family protein [Candidatus Heimdallarchaeota archaeon]|nr:MAG: 2-oxoacid:acceptor oxidoreductase family protein [Candidatus Heimdallarchaeota archaeon]